MNLVTIATIVGVVVGTVLLIVVSFLTMWKKVGQDRAGIVTGLKKKVISGGGGFVIPLLQRIDYISLENMQIQADVKGLTSSGVPVSVGSLTVIKIKNEEQSILDAMEQFHTGDMRQTVANIIGISKEVLEGKLREIMSSMTVEELYKDRENFALKVNEIAGMDLSKMGLEIKTFTIKDIFDSQGYIEALGKERTAVVKKEADIAEANALSERDIAVAEAKKKSAIEVANRVQETAEAKATADIKIADAEREKEVKIQENREKTEIQRARADQAYKIEANRTEQSVVESELAIEVARETKQIEVVEAQSAVKLKEESQETEIAKQRALRTAQELESEIQKKAEAAAAKTKTDADADLFKRQKEAEAQKYEEIAKSEAEAVKKERQASADAEAVTKKAEADAIAKQKIADAEAGAIKAKGLADAEAEKAVGLAKAEAVRAQGLAEAEVIKQKALAEAEGKKQLAEAYKLYGEAAMAEMFIRVLPDITKPVAEAVSSSIGKIGDITILDTNGKGGTSKLTNMATDLLTETSTAVEAISGINLKGLLTKFANNALNGENIISDDIANIDE